MLSFKDYAGRTTVKNIFVFKYRPQVYRKQILNRSHSSFLYVIEGRYLYEMDKERVNINAGEAVYLPKGASYTYNVVSQQTKGIQVEFDLEADGESVVFASRPVVFSENAHMICELLEEMLRISMQDKWSAIGTLYRVIGLFCTGFLQENGTGMCERIIPAVQFIETHLKSKIYVEELAALCNVSESHLRRLFTKYLGVSPIQYKNRVLVQEACRLLRGTGMNVSETVEVLGFSDVYTFSQFFKKEIGISPKKYMNLL